jgi:hypothetical protein
MRDEILYFIEEQCSPVEQRIEILSESTDNNGKNKSFKFKAYLQEADVVNQNRRIYRKEALNAGVESIRERMKKGIFFCEMDHPITNDPRRFTTVLLKNASHRVLDIGWKNNLLEGICATTSNSVGKDLRALIEQDGIPVGFSVRAVGKTRKDPSMGITEVASNMRVFSWDAVSNPSHKTALTQEILNENTVNENNAPGINELLVTSEVVNCLTESVLGMEHDVLVDPNDILKVAFNPLTEMVILNNDITTIQALLEDSIVNEIKHSFKSLIEKSRNK